MSKTGVGEKTPPAGDGENAVYADIRTRLPQRSARFCDGWIRWEDPCRTGRGAVGGQSTGGLPGSSAGIRRRPGAVLPGRSAACQVVPIGRLALSVCGEPGRPERPRAGSTRAVPPGSSACIRWRARPPWTARSGDLRRDLLGRNGGRSKGGRRMVERGSMTPPWDAASVSDQVRARRCGSRVAMRRVYAGGPDQKRKKGRRAMRF